MGSSTDTKTVAPRFYSTASLTTVATPTAAISWDAVGGVCSNVVRYLEVTYTLSTTLTIEVAAIKVVYGSLAASGTSTPSLLYSAVARNTVSYDH